MKSSYALAIASLAFISSTHARPSPAAAPVIVTPTVATQVDPRIQDRLERSLSNVVREKGLPAMAVAVVRGNAIVASASAGVKSLGSGQAIAVSDRFHVASLAKPMTATVVGTLVEEGRLKWTTPVLQIFPEWRSHTHPALRSVTLQQILQHRAGFHPFRAGSDWDDQGVPNLKGQLVEQRRQFARWLMSKAPANPPGTFEYSNAGYVVAAAMVEKVTDQPWERLIQTRLFAPLGMKSAGFGWPRTVGPNQPEGHYLREGGLYEPQAATDTYALRTVMAPGGDIHMNVEDLARFAAAHLAGLRGADTVVKASTVKHLHTPPPGGTYALGWDLDTSQFEEPWSQHTGATGTFRARVWIFPQSNLAFVAAANADSDDVHRSASLVFQQVRAVARAKYE